MKLFHDLIGHHVPKWNTLNLKHPNQIKESKNQFREPIQSINDFHHQINQKDRYHKHMNEDSNGFYHQDGSNDFYGEHSDEDEMYSNPQEEELRHRYKFDEYHTYEHRPQDSNVHEKPTKENKLFAINFIQ